MSFMALIFSDGFDDPSAACWQGDIDRRVALQILKNACMHLIDAPKVDIAALRILRRCQRRMIAEEAVRRAGRLDPPTEPPDGFLMAGGGFHLTLNPGEFMQF